MSLEINEHREHAEHGAHDRFVGGVSITIAVLAAAAAVVTSLEQVETAATITDYNRAVLVQSRASDQWAYYQAKSVKKHIYSLAADENFPNADRYRKTAAKEAQDGDAVAKEAKGFEAQRDRFYEDADTHEVRHHRLAIGATLLEIGIAISTVAIITRKWGWWGLSSVLGLGGIVLAAGAYFGFGVI
jgi:hypothetical protein